MNDSSRVERALDNYPDDMEVMTKKTEIGGNIAHVNSVKQDSYGYGFFGADISCVLLTDEFEENKEG